VHYFRDNSVSEGLGRQSVRGGAISILSRGINAVLQVASVLFLARLLTPEDYGLVAMVTALTGFAPVLVDLGTKDAVVQRLSITEEEVSSLFWLTMGVGVALALLVSASGSVIAGFYHEPRLTPIVLVSSLTFVASALTAQHQGLLRRAVMFRELAIIDVVSNVLSISAAVVIAYVGFGYWALVIRPVAMYSLTAVGTWMYCRWLPRKPVVTGGVKQMVSFGLSVSGFSLTDFVGRNSDRVAVGHGLGARTLGFYQNALFIYDNLLDVLVFQLHQVAIASLSKLQNDLVELRRSWAKALSTATFYAMPAFGVLAVTSRDLVIMLLGPKWASAGVILSVLALRGIPHSAERTLGWLHVAAGKTNRWFRWGVAATCGQLLALVIGIRFGTMGVAYAYVIFMFISFIPALAYAGHPLGIKVRDVIRAVGAQLVGALTAVALGFALRPALTSFSSFTRTAILGVSYAAVYLLVVAGMFRVTMPLRVCMSLVSDFLPVRLRPRTQMSFDRNAAGVEGLNSALLDASDRVDV
jgi:PST family polysaccharide transporter